MRVVELDIWVRQTPEVSDGLHPIVRPVYHLTLQPHELLAKSACK
jgi:hypothetical protein